MSAVEQQISANPPADAKLVFVVDDEAMIGDVVQMILRLEGYNSKYFQDPERAWAAFVKEEPKPALLLTDYLMAPFNGLELIERCKALHPKLKTILYSGNADEIALQGRSVQPDAFLRKPFLPSKLMALLHTTLSVIMLCLTTI